MADPDFTDHVLTDLLAWRRAGHKAALITLFATSGSGPRAPGAQMAVREDGQRIGFVSGGCVEAALAAEAVEALADGTPRKIRYGDGSPYMDIVLPCGSAIDLFIDPVIPTDPLERLERAVTERRPARLITDLADGRSAVETDVDGWRPGAPGLDLDRGRLLSLSGTRFSRIFLPTPRLILAGTAPVADSLARMAALAGFRVETISPEDDDGISGAHRRLDDDTVDRRLALDRFTGLITLYHDHDFELPLLAAGLRSDAFYLGALGSRRTHAGRLDKLRDAGFADHATGRIHGPVGLDIAAATPPEIAVSILAEAVARYRAFLRDLPKTLTATRAA